MDDAAADRAARELHGMPGAPVLLRGKEGLEELAAVSYTHLDVYKRQAGDRRHRGICGQDLQRNKSASTLHHQRDDIS